MSRIVHSVYRRPRHVPLQTFNDPPSPALQTFNDLPSLPSAMSESPRPDHRNDPAGSPSPTSPLPPPSPTSPLPARRVVDLQPDEATQQWELDEDEVLADLGTTSHRSRNRHEKSVPVRKQNPRVRSSQVETTKRAARESKMKRFNAELKQMRDEREVRAVELAKTYGMKLIEVRRRMMLSTVVKQKRRPSLHNAKMSRIARDINKDLPRSSKLKMPEVNAMVRNDPSLYEDFDSDEEEEMLKELEEQRELKGTGIRANNLAAQQVASATITRIGKLMNALSASTGVISLAMFSRTHAHDTTGNHWIETDGASAFVSQSPYMLSITH